MNVYKWLKSTTLLVQHHHHAFTGDFGEGFAVEAIGGDGVADAEGHVSTVESSGVHRQNFVSAGDRQGNDGNAGFDGDIGGAVLEWMQDAVVGAASFGKNEDGDVAGPDGVRCERHGFNGGAGISAWDRDVAGLAEMRA